MKKIFAIAALLFAGLGFAQININDYKYIIVPEKFDFFKEPNKYNLNKLTKMVFEKQGFQVFYPNDKMPDDLALNKCRALYGDLIDDSGMLSTAITIVLKDCGGQEIFRSARGKSKIKDFQKAYYESLREAAVSVTDLHYQYTGKDAVAVQAGKEMPAAPQTPVTPQPDRPAQILPPAATPETVVNESQLFAQPISNGYQLVDSTPKVVLKIYKTSQQDNYTAVGDNKNGVVFKKGNDWFFEYYLNDKLVSEKLNIKF